MFRWCLLILYFLSFKCLACEVIDDTNKKIHLSQPAERIVSLAPDLTEILFAVGAGKKIVGVDSASDYPSAVKNIPVIASYNSLQLENILALHPDLIVVWSDTNYLSQLKKLNIPLYVSRQQNLSDIPKTMRRLGCLAGTEKIAGQAAREYQEHYQRLETRYAHPKKSLRVFYQVWPMPLMTVTKRSWIDEVITLCGGKNIFADLHGVAPEINIEAVLAADPDIILGTNSKALQQWQAWPTLRAVQRKQVYVIHSDLIERASPRILDGVQEMCRQFAAGEALLQTFPQ